MLASTGEHTSLVISFLDLLRTLRDAFKRPRVSVVLQSGAAECGVAALQMILVFHGLRDVRGKIRRATGYPARGIGVDALLESARACGMDAAAFEVSVHEMEKLPTPAILHWTRGHFVVLEGRIGTDFLIVDPAIGRRRMRREELEASFSGIAVGLEPLETGSTSSFQEPPSALTEAVQLHWRELSILGVAIAAELLALVLVLHQATLLFTVDQRRVSGIPASLWQLATALTIGIAAHFAVTVLDRRLLQGIGAHIMLRFSAALEAAPPAFLATRGERTLEEIAADADPAINPLVPLPSGLLRIIAAPALLFVSLSSSPALFVVTGLGIAAEIAFAVWRDRLGTIRTTRKGPLYRSRLALRAALDRTYELKSAGVLGTALERWRRYRVHAESLIPRRYVSAPTPAFSVAMSVAVAGCVAWDEQAAGRLVPAAALFALLIATSAIITFSTSMGEYVKSVRWRRNLNRVDDILRELSTDNTPSITAPAQALVEAPLTVVSLHDLTYRFSGDTEDRLRGVCMTVQDGESVAIVGASGAGKTLLARILLGELLPTGGSILLEGIELDEHSVARGGDVIAAVLAGISGTQMTIAEYLLMDHDIRSSAAVARAAGIVGLDDWLRGLPMGVSTPIGSLGQGLAEHQRRLLSLVRTLVEPPRILVVDGALDALDSELSQHVASRLRTSIRSVILFTTRPESVPSAYLQYRLEGGRLTRGSPRS